MATTRRAAQLGCLAAFMLALLGPAAAQEAERLPPGTVAPVSINTVGASQNYRDFIQGYLQYVAEVTPPYPPLPGGNKLPPLPEQFRADVNWARASGRGPYPAVIKGRPWSLTPQAQDPLQNGTISRQQPGAAWVSRLPKKTPGYPEGYHTG